MRDVVIYGASALGRMVYDILRQSGQVHVVGFLDSDASKHHQIIDGLPVLGGLEATELLIRKKVRGVVVAIGESLPRVRMARRLRDRGAELISAIHPLATISRSARLGEHLIIGARAIICVHSQIGAHSIIATGVIVEHDNRVGRGVFLHPAARLAGGVRVGNFATLGIGACVIPGRTIGRQATVAPGAIVIRNVPDRASVSGAPAQAVGEARLDAPGSFTPGRQPVALHS